MTQIWKGYTVQGLNNEQVYTRKTKRQSWNNEQVQLISDLSNSVPDYF